MEGAMINLIEGVELTNWEREGGRPRVDIEWQQLPGTITPEEWVDLLTVMSFDHDVLLETIEVANLDAEMLLKINRVMTGENLKPLAMEMFYGKMAE
jgi:hypothetical protein